MPKTTHRHYESDVYLRSSYSDLTKEIALVREEIEAADNLFQNASDPDLIDSYIFQGNGGQKTIQFFTETGQTPCSGFFLRQKQEEKLLSGISPPEIIVQQTFYNLIVTSRSVL